MTTGSGDILMLSAKPTTYDSESSRTTSRLRTRGTCSSSRARTSGEHPDGNRLNVRAHQNLEPNAVHLACDSCHKRKPGTAADSGGSEKGSSVEGDADRQRDKDSGSKIRIAAVCASAGTVPDEDQRAPSGHVREPSWIETGRRREDQRRDQRNTDEASGPRAG